MLDLNIASNKCRGVCIATIVAVSSTLFGAVTASATTLQVSVENLTPTNGADITPVWFAFHDGSFDSFNVGSAASAGIEHLAEDAITGLEGTIPGVVPYLLANGLNPATLPAPSDTIAGIFANSAAATNGGVQGLVINPSNPLGIFSGETFSSTIQINNPTQNRYFNYGAMFFPSNDAFIGNDNAIQVFDANGNFIGADFIVVRSQLWDAGTEVNDELSTSVPFTLDLVGQGTTEGGVVSAHPGFKAPGSGGVLDVPLFANAVPNPDNNPNYQIARIRITQVPESSNIAGLLVVGSLGLISGYWRRKS